MDDKNLDSLAKLIDGVASTNTHSNKMRITNPQYVSFYVTIFMDEIEKNNGTPTPYDAFGDRLWIKINKLVNSYPNESEEFINVWTGWVTLYRHLKELNKIQN